MSILNTLQQPHLSSTHIHISRNHPALSAMPHCLSPPLVAQPFAHCLAVLSPMDLGAAYFSRPAGAGRPCLTSPGDAGVGPVLPTAATSARLAAGSLAGLGFSGCHGSRKGRPLRQDPGGGVSGPLSGAELMNHPVRQHRAGRGRVVDGHLRLKGVGWKCLADRKQRRSARDRAWGMEGLGKWGKSSCGYHGSRSHHGLHSGSHRSVSHRLGSHHGKWEVRRELCLSGGRWWGSKDGCMRFGGRSTRCSGESGNGEGGHASETGGHGSDPGKEGSPLAEEEPTRGPIVLGDREGAGGGGGSSRPPPDKKDEDDEPLLFHMDAFNVLELLGPARVDLDDIRVLKEKVFGYGTFWVTGQEPFGEAGEGVLLQGNLRGDRRKVHAQLRAAMEGVVGRKYDLFMVEEPRREEEDGEGGPRVAFVVLRKEVNAAKPVPVFQYILAAILVIITGGACLEIGLASQISRLPAELAAQFTSADLDAFQPPDPEVLMPYVEGALPIAYGIFGVQVFHEVAHYLVARSKDIKLGIPLFIPSTTIGSIGAITQVRSLLPDRTARFDLAIAGPLAGSALSLSMFLVGCLLSTHPSPDLISVPSQLLPGSFALGAAVQAVLGPESIHQAQIPIHPLVITGWCGLTSNALNLLPFGCLDGGKAMQACYGKTALQVTGVITLLLLALGVLGGNVALPFGLFAILLQRVPEKDCLDNVSGVGAVRQGVLLASLVGAISVLVPMWSELIETIGIAAPSSF